MNVNGRHFISIERLADVFGPRLDIVPRRGWAEIRLDGEHIGPMYALPFDAATEGYVSEIDLAGSRISDEELEKVGVDFGASNG